MCLYTSSQTLTTIAETAQPVRDIEWVKKLNRGRKMCTRPNNYIAVVIFWTLYPGTSTSAWTCLAEFSSSQQLSATLERWSATWTQPKMRSTPRYGFKTHPLRNSLQMVLSHDQSAEKLQNGVLLQVDCIKAYLVFRKTPKELETRLASSNSQRRRKKLIRPYSKIASGRSTGSSTFGTTTSLEMNKRSSQSYQWRFLRMRFVRVSNNLADWDLFQTSHNLKRSCVSAAGRDRYARQPWNSEEGSAVPGDKCLSIKF